MRWFALVMSVAYIAMGSALCFTRLADDVIVKQRALIGGLLIAYGAFRGYLWYRKSKSATDRV
jgi:hypothetical protein